MGRRTQLMRVVSFFWGAWAFAAGTAPTELQVMTHGVPEVCSSLSFSYLNYQFYRCTGAGGLAPGLLAMSNAPGTDPIRYEVGADGSFAARTPMSIRADGSLRYQRQASHETGVPPLPGYALWQLRAHTLRLREVLSQLDRDSETTREVRRILEAGRTESERLDRRLRAPTLNLELGSGPRVSCRTANAHFATCTYYVCDEFVRNGKRCSSVFRVSNATQFSPQVSTLCDGELAAPEVARLSDSETLSEYQPMSGGITGGNSVVPPEFLPYLDLLRTRNDLMPIGERRACRSPALTELLKQHDAAKATLIQRLNDQELVTWVRRLNGSELTSTLIPRSMLPSGACRVSEGVFGQAGENDLARSFSGEPIELAQAERVMQDVLAMNDIPFESLADGCYARAEIIAQRLQSRGVEVEKVWIRGGALGPANAPGIAWQYHVAPVIRVRLPSGQTENRVIDPSTRRRLLTIEEWTAANSRGSTRPVMTTWPVPDGGWYDRPLVYFTPPEVFALDSPAAQVRMEDAWVALRRHSGLNEQGEINQQFSDRPLLVQNSGEGGPTSVRLGNSSAIYTIDAADISVLGCVVGHLHRGTSARLESRPNQTRITRCW